jgi:recombination protein RecT
MANSQKIITFDQAFKKASNQFSKLRTNSDLKFAEEKQHVQALMRTNPKLRICTPESIYQSMLQIATMGLSLNPIKQQVYLIPRKARKRKQGESQSEYDKVPSFCYASPSYRGLSHLCQLSGAVLFIRAEVVFKTDKFEYFGPHKEPKHVVGHFQNRSEQDAIGVYAIAKLKSGDYLTELMDRETVLKIRQMSEQPNAIMWDANRLWDQGWRKSVIRRLTKTLPIDSSAFNAATQIMDQYESISINDPSVIESEIIPVITEEQQTELHALLTDNGIDNADQWLSKLAVKYDLENISDLPEKYFKAARDFLILAINSRGNKE